jgi:hypothetical protein
MNYQENGIIFVLSPDSSPIARFHLSNESLFSAWIAEDVSR